MHWKTLAVLGSLWGVLLPVSTLAQEEPRYEVIDLGALSGGQSTALAISDAGYVVGHSTTEDPDGNPVRHAVLWLLRPVGSMTPGIHDLGTFDTVGNSLATGVNDSLQITGYSDLDETLPRGILLTHAFLWEGGEMTDLGTLSPGFLFSGGEDLNELGQVAVWEGSGFACLPAIWLPDPDYGLPAGLNSVPRPAGFGEGLVTAINDRGEMIGFATQACDVAGEDVAFIWLPNDAYGLPAGAHEIDAGEGLISTQADAINNLGQVAGTVTDTSSGFSQQLFLWQAGASTVLGNPPGHRGTRPYGINDSTQIVGISNQTAFLWEGGQFFDLNTLIDEDSGWVLRTAYAINNQGWIVGEGLLNGVNRAFLLRSPGSILEIPTLSSSGLAMLIVLLVVAGLVSMRRRGLP